MRLHKRTISVLEKRNRVAGYSKDGEEGLCVSVSALACRKRCVFCPFPYQEGKQTGATVASVSFPSCPFGFLLDRGV